MSYRCAFSRRESGFQWWPFGHTWGERGEREPEDPDHWHRHRPVHLKHGTRLTSPLNIHSAHFRRIGAEGPWKLLFVRQRSAWMLAEEKQPSYSTHSALWRTCRVFSARAKTCRAASPVLFRAWMVAFSCSKANVEADVCPSSRQTLAVLVFGGPTAACTPSSLHSSFSSFTFQSQSCTFLLPLLCSWAIRMKEDQRLSLQTWMCFCLAVFVFLLCWSS